MNIQVESGDIWAMGESVAAELSTGTFFLSKITLTNLYTNLFYGISNVLPAIV